MKKGTHVYLPEQKQQGIVISEASTDGRIEVLTNDGIIKIAETLVILWESISFFRKLFILLFKKAK